MRKEYYELYEIRPGVELRRSYVPLSYERTESHHITERCGTLLKTPGERASPSTPRRRRACVRVSGTTAAEIRKAYARGGVTQAEIARVFGLSQARVSQIIRGK